MNYSITKSIFDVLLVISILLMLALVADMVPILGSSITLAILLFFIVFLDRYLVKLINKGENSNETRK